MEPGVNISFQNGQLGTIEPMEDGTTMIVFAKYKHVEAVEDEDTGESVEDGRTENFIAYGNSDNLSTWVGLEAMTNVLDESEMEEVKLCIRLFYGSYSNTGTPLHILYVWRQNILMRQDAVAAAVEEALLYTNGAIRQVGLFGVGKDSEGNDIDKVSLAKQIRWKSLEHKAPVLVVVRDDGNGNASVTDADGVVIAVDVFDIFLLSRLASIPVQRHIGRVADGPIPFDAYTKIALEENVQYTAEQIKQEFLRMGAVMPILYAGKNVVIVTSYPGKDGIYFGDDHTATEVTDDYHSIARRRVADKAYRVAYQTLTDYVNDELPVNADGTLTAPAAKGIEQTLTAAIYNSMTAEGNLSVDDNDPSDKGVKVSVDTTNDFVATSTLNVTLQIKPYGYAKYIDVKLGFLKE